jgi:pimeloyl-ACP methyl ester carboxylesterase
MLCGPGFADVWPTFENSLGLERIPEPARSVVLAGRRVDQDVVVGYWEPLLRTDAGELQAWIDDHVLPKIDSPCLGVFGRPVTERERERFARLADAQLEEWPGDGHCVHLVNPDRFATRLRQFVDYCTGGARA